MPKLPDDALENLLVNALKEAEIPERDNTNWLPRLFGGTIAYWQRGKRDIEIVFRSTAFGGGRLDCSIFLEHLVKREVEHHSTNDEAVDSLVSILKYLRVVVSDILPALSNHLSARSFNQLSKKIQKDLIQTGLFSEFQADLESYLTERLKSAIKELRAEPRSRRGGSEPKLPDKERNEIHRRYSALLKVARDIKPTYNAELKRFARSRAAKGYSHQQWCDHWGKYCGEHFPVELKELLGMFAGEESPSSSDVVYEFLSRRTGHARSYLPRLVAESRKASKPETFKTKE